MMVRPSGSVTVLGSAARTVLATGSVGGANHRGAHIVVKITAGTGGFSVVPSIEGYNAVSDSWYTILTGAALTGTGTTYYSVYPGIAASAGVAVSDCLPAVWRVSMTPADTKSITYSVGANLLN